MIRFHETTENDENIKVMRRKTQSVIKIINKLQKENRQIMSNKEKMTQNPKLL